MTVNFNAGFGMSQLPQMDPDSYAKQYAEKNNISLEEAKEQLKSQYGDPQSNAMAGSAAGSIWDTGTGPQQEGDPDFLNGIDSSYGNIGINSSSTQMSPGMDPDTFARQYAYQNNMTFEEAKAELESKYGKPQQLDIQA